MSGWEKLLLGYKSETYGKVVESLETEKTGKDSRNYIKKRR